jgi:large repetitive protein
VNASTVTRVSSTRIQARVPLLATSGPIGITNPAGAALSAAPFHVTPSITGFKPTQGPVGTAVTVSGSGFVGAPTVRFGTVATSPTSVSLTALVALVPSGAPTGSITVMTTEGSGNTSAVFTVIRTPTLVSFTPASGAAGTVVTLVGIGLTTTGTVQFNGIAANTSAVNGSVTTSLLATVPTDATTGRITVTNAAGTVTSGADFHVLPTVTGFSPASGAAGDVVTISGNALNETTIVRFGGAAATVVSSNASQVVAIVPGTAVTGRISVTTIEGTATSSSDFEVLAPIAMFGVGAPTSPPRLPNVRTAPAKP